MSSASLAVPRHAHPDSARIAALSFAMAINLVALLALVRPMAPQWAEQVQRLTETQIHFITPPPKAIEPPPIELKPIVQPKAIPQPHTQPLPISPPALTSENDANALPASPPSLAPAGHDVPSSPVAGPVEATLAYRAIPLKYPPQALRGHMQGTVVLKVLVDEQGVPQEATVEQSSGYTLLDRSAREQVLQGWKFQPAMVNGQPARAWARVPVSFNLNQL
jgi:periplasmic protein TonB